MKIFLISVFLVLGVGITLDRMQYNRLDSDITTPKPFNGNLDTIYPKEVKTKCWEVYTDKEIISNKFKKTRL